MDELSIIEYLNKKGITITGHYFDHDKNMYNKDIVSQIELIIELHKTLIGCKFNGLSRIKSIIGKEVESYKVQIKKLKIHYDYITDKPYKNDIENLILSKGIIMLNKAEKAINHIYEHGYYGAIRRSMNREEICIGKIDRSNLRKIEGKIQIGTIKGMAYNLVEEDLYTYIKKLQRKDADIDEEELIKLFVRGSHLSFNSIDYLRGLCSYPKDFLKMWERYRDRKRENINKINLNANKINYINDEKEKTNDDILSGLGKSLKYESKSFII